MNKLKRLAKVVFLGETAFTGCICLLASLGAKDITLFTVISTWFALDVGFLFLTAALVAFIVCLFWVNEGNDGESYLDFFRRHVKEELE